MENRPVSKGTRVVNRYLIFVVWESDDTLNLNPQAPKNPGHLICVAPQETALSPAQVLEFIVQEIEFRVSRFKCAPESRPQETVLSPQPPACTQASSASALPPPPVSKRNWFRVEDLGFRLVGVYGPIQEKLVYGV